MAMTEIGSYQEVEEIGRGGMAVVYRAVTLLLPFIVRLCGFVMPLSAPLQPSNR